MHYTSWDILVREEDQGVGVSGHREDAAGIFSPLQTVPTIFGGFAVCRSPERSRAIRGHHLHPL